MKSNGTSRIDLNEGISNGFAAGRSPQGGPSYYYSTQPSLVHTSTRSLNQPPPPVIQPVHHTASAASSPAQPVLHTYRTVTTTKVDPPHRSGTLPANPITRRTPSLPAQGMEPPSYYVEHLASFAVGREHGLVSTADGIKKLKEMEQKSAVFAQPMILKLYPDRISVEEENGEVVEQFNIELVTEPTAHQSNDPHDVFNNVILFTVKEDTRNGRRSFVPTEMHIFQCVRVSAQDLASDIYQYMRKNYHKVKGGRRGGEYGYTIPPPAPSSYYDGHTSRRDYRDETGGGGGDYFEVDVNMLNKCFDDIERFVARIQSAAIAQRELELYNHRFRTNQRKHRAQDAALAAQHGILQMRAQLPTYQEFYDVFQKFKLSFNLLAKLKNHIREPNAPELLHFLFTPLTVILDACHWGLNRNVAQEVISPLLTYDACDLLRNCLISKEQEVWAALGKAWRTPPEDWTGPPVPLYRPIFNTPHFVGTFEPPSRYAGAPNAIHRGASAPPPQQHFAPPYRGPPHRERSVDNIDLEKVNLEKERLEFERMKVREREARLQEEERRLKQEQARLEAERRLLHKEAEKHSMAGSDRPDFYHEYSSHSPRVDRRTASVQQLNGHVSPASPRPNIPIPIPDQSPRQKAYLDDLIQRRAKVVQVTYDRVAQNAKELTVDRGEYLEVLNDTKNWWECKNASEKVGYVPHTILALVTVDETVDRIQGLPQHNPSALQPGSAISPRPGHYQTSEPSSIRSYDQTLLDRLHSVKLRPILDELTPSEPGSFHSRPSQRLPKLIMQEQKYVPEMVATIKSNAPIIGLRRASSIRGPQLTPNSAISKVQSWLTAKGFSDYTKKVLSKCQGLHLFQLTKELLFKYCGEEGNRLFSLILAQKKRCNYESTRGDQLKALLDMRKEHVDENNEAELEPNLDPPEILDKNGNNIIKQNNPLTLRQVYKTSPHSIVPINPYKEIQPENRAIEYLRDISHTVRVYH